MPARIDPELTEPDTIVINNLFDDIQRTSVHDCNGNGVKTPHIDPQNDDKIVIEKLAKFEKEPTVFCSWDFKQLPPADGLVGRALRHYTAVAQTIVRYPVDVVFLTHILIYMSTSVPSAIYLYYNFTWLHGVLHWLMQMYYCGPFTLLLHNCIHQNGLLSRRYAIVDRIWPYILEPLMGHTWDSYFYHHVKHHHVEGNGPEDLSSTIRYQRDELSHFLMYVGRFLALVWLELPLYFFRRRRTALGIKCAVSEFASYAFVYVMSRYNFRASLFVLILPLLLMRIGLMVGNFGQHALVDDVDPKSDFRSSITLIDVPSNRYCFNDGYHTSHHLNPLRHWRDHQAAFMKAKKEYISGQALVFHNIDYLMMTYHLLRKNYLHLADCMIPIGDQVKLTRQQKADLLRSKTRRFTEEEIQQKFYSKKSS